MEVVIDFEFLRGRTNEIIVKELSIAAANVSDSFRFKSPYPMTTHRSVENGLNWDDGHIAYSELYTVVNEAVAGFAHLYAYGIAKCAFLTELLSRQFSTCKTLIAPCQNLSIINTGAACRITNFPM